MSLSDIKLESNISTILITGANSGLGKDTAQKLAAYDGVTKIYLACRNPERAATAKKELEEATKKSIFEVVIMDVSDMESVKKAVTNLKGPIDALLMNAGGLGGDNSGEKTKDGVMKIMAMNVFGHVVLLEELLKAGKLTKCAVFSGSEAARGLPLLMFWTPTLKTGSVDEFVSICDGSYFGSKKHDPMTTYGYAKLLGAYYMSSMARKYPKVRILTVSPGGTSGTNAADHVPNALLRGMFKVCMPLMSMLGVFHKLEVGTQRYIDVLLNKDEQFESGSFFASRRGASGDMVNQKGVTDLFGNMEYEENAYEAIHQFLK